VTGFWNPQFWNSIGVVGLVVLMGFMLLVALQRGWVVIGLHHREIIAAKDSTIAQFEARAVKDADAIGTLSKAITEKAATDDATTRILSALREAVSTGDR
jgi:hypothetical protein